MAAGEAPAYIDQVLESAENPPDSARQILKEWEGKPAQEKTIACRKLLYGMVSPTLHETFDADVVAEVEAMFETTFASIEQSALQRGRRLSSST